MAGNVLHGSDLPGPRRRPLQQAKDALADPALPVKELAYRRRRAAAGD